MVLLLLLELNLGVTGVRRGNGVCFVPCFNLFSVKPDVSSLASLIACKGLMLGVTHRLLDGHKVISVLGDYRLLPIGKSDSTHVGHRGVR